MTIFHFPIPNDDEMLAGVERVRSFLSIYDNQRFKFFFTGRGKSKGPNICEVELEFDDPQAGDDALCLWCTYRCLSG